MDSQEMTQAVASEPTGVVLLGGAHGALAAARSLGRKNIPVAYVTDDHPLPKFSRYVRESFDWPGPQAPHAVQWLLDLATKRNWKEWLLIPCADADVKMIAENRDILRNTFRVIAPDWSILKSVCDKKLLAEFATHAGVAFPRSYQIGSSADASTVDVSFPVILKPARREVRSAFTTAKAWRAETRDELTRLYDEAAATVGQSEVVVQEYIPGGGGTEFSYAALWDRGTPVAEMVVRRTRQFPLDFGTSCFVETTTEPRILEAARRLLGMINYEGLVEIDFKFDARDSQFKPLDVNTRVWAWIALGESAGLDFILLLFHLANGERDIPFKASGGHHWMHFARDIVASVRLISRGELAFSDYLSSYSKPVTWATFAWDDPMPGILELPLTAYRVLCRALLSIRNRGECGPQPGSQDRRDFKPEPQPLRLNHARDDNFTSMPTKPFK
jgi:D-aspartate ligase